MPTLFISDLHLHPSRPRIIDCFLRFIDDQKGRADALYILGDLFEVWIGDDHPEPAYQAIRTALARCSTAGTPVFLLHGNRDFLIGDCFAAETGCTLRTDLMVIDLYGTRTLLMHGDTLCTDDTEYQSFRSRVRDSAWQKKILALPATQRLELAAQARETSTRLVQDKDEYIMDANQHEVLRVMKQHQVTLLIHGHTHRPAVHSIDINGSKATRIVLGDWYTQGSVLVVDQDGWNTQILQALD